MILVSFVQTLAGAAGQTLRLTGYATDDATGLDVCYSANVDICAASSPGAGRLPLPQEP